MRINDLANNNNSISNGTAAGVSLDLSLVQGAVSPEKNRSAALLNQNMGAVGFFYTSEKKPVMDTGKATYTLNDAKGVEKDKGMGEKLLDSIGDASRRDRELVKNLTKDDYDSLNEEGMSLEKFGKERLERAIERIKEDRRIKEERLSEGAEKLKVYNETIDRMAETAHAETGEEKRIAMLLAKADIPVTKDNIEEVEQALDRRRSPYRLRIPQRITL